MHTAPMDNIRTSECVDRIYAGCAGAVEKSVAAYATVPAPTMHLLVDGLDPPYLGYVTCRPFYRGNDAARAIAASASSVRWSLRRGSL